MKVWVVSEMDRDMDVTSITVYKNKPDWEPDFYEHQQECEVIENTVTQESQS